MRLWLIIVLVAGAAQAADLAATWRIVPDAAASHFVDRSGMIASHAIVSVDCEDLGEVHQAGRRRTLDRRTRSPNGLVCQADGRPGRCLCAEPDRPHPNFIPVLGYLDDLLIVPLGIKLVVPMIPLALMIEFRAEAMQRATRPTSMAGAIVIGAIWVAGAAVLMWTFWPRPNRKDQANLRPPDRG